MPTSKFDIKYHHLFHHARWGIAATDGKIICIGNPYLNQMHGFEDDELDNQLLNTLYPKESEVIWQDALAAVHLHGHHVFEAQHLRNDGSTFPALIDLSKIEYSQQSATPFFAITVQDITEQKNALDQQKQLQAQLVQAQKLESFGMLAGGIAHDFNNLLSGIIGFSDLVMGQLPKDHPSREAISFIREAGMKGANLTKQLLAFSRRQTLKTSEVEINELLSNMVSMLDRILGEHIKINVKPLTKNNMTLADQGQIEQVIMNLAINARDAIDKSGSITITTSRIKMNKSQCHHHGVKAGLFNLIQFADTGSGIEPEFLSNIFEPFFSTKKDNGGTGLGLATVYGIIKQHNGFIEVDSEHGTGTCFNIYLPFKVQQEEKKSLPKSSKLPTKGKETILVVEDDNSVRNLIIEIMKLEGYALLEADSAETAVKILQQSPIDLVLSDIVMAGMNGMELAQLIRSRHPETKVVLMSGYTDDILAKHGAKREEEKIIDKPVTPATLLQHIRTTLDHATTQP